MEWLELNRVNNIFGAGFGLAFAYYGRRYAQRATAYSPLFRKPWMKLLIPTSFFFAGWYGGMQVRARVLTHGGPRSDVTPEKMSGDADLLSQFRPGYENKNEEQLSIVTMLSKNTDISKSGIADAVLAKLVEKANLLDKYQIKRTGKDEDDIFWTYGKIHSLENIAYVPDEVLEKVEGNPVRLQRAIYDAQIPVAPAASYEELTQKMNENLIKYKATIKGMSLTKSDEKKLLALPFYLNRRTQMPAPKPGQWQYDMFEELYGRPYDAFAKTEIDEQKKVTLFDYENFFPAGLLKHIDTESEEFQNDIKRLNYSHQTKLEKEHNDFMPLFAHLTEEEGRILVHKMKNDKHLNTLRSLHSGQKEADLAKIVEEENFNQKNRYRLDKLQLEYADKKRMAIDQSKLKQVLQHHDQFRSKFDDEIGTYQEWKKNTEFQNKALGIFHETAFGSMRKLREEIGIENRDTQLPWMKWRDVVEAKEKAYTNPEGDPTFSYLMNALFTPIDMTEYENSFLGEYHTNQFPTSSGHQRNRVNSQWYPFTIGTPTLEEGTPTKWGLTNSQDEKREEIPEEDPYAELEEDDDDEDEDDDEEEEWTNGEEDDSMYEEVEWPPKKVLAPQAHHLDFFNTDENLREKYNDEELGAFMKILDVKPFKQWQDQSVYHHSMGPHTYEDESQHLDPAYHMLAEVEREHVERWETQEFRKGSEVRFQIGDKTPVFPKFNY